MSQTQVKAIAKLRKRVAELEIRLSYLNEEIERASDKSCAAELALDAMIPYLDQETSSKQLDAKLEQGQRARLRQSLVEIEVPRFCHVDTLKECLVHWKTAPFTFSIACVHCGVMIRHIKHTKDRSHLPCETCGACNTGEHLCQLRATPL